MIYLLWIVEVIPSETGLLGDQEKRQKKTAEDVLVELFGLTRRVFKHLWTEAVMYYYYD